MTLHAFVFFWRFSDTSPPALLLLHFLASRSADRAYTKPLRVRTKLVTPWDHTGTA